MFSSHFKLISVNIKPVDSDGSSWFAGINDKITQQEFTGALAQTLVMVGFQR
jgi:hypothetical protein